MVRHVLVKRFLFRVLLACIIVLPTIPTRVSADNTKVLYLADWFGLIWSMDLETQMLLGSFPVEPSPTGLALLDGVLYVSTVFPNQMFSFDPNTGTQLSKSDITPILDGLATIPEARLIAGIEPSFDQPEVIHLYRPSTSGYGLEEAYDPIPLDVPGDAVRALAYAQGQFYISEESTQAIHVYGLDLTGTIPVLTYNQALMIYFPAPGLAYDGNNLVAYDISEERIVVVSPSTGGTIDSFSLTGTGISDIVAGLEVGGGGYPKPIAVNVDIKPGSFPNSIDPKSKGVIPVAILTTDTFDAATVDPLSVKFGPSGATEAQGRGQIEDADGDGDLDLVLRFRTQDTGITCGATAASLTGETFTGQPITGSDSIKTVGCN